MELKPTKLKGILKKTKPLSPTPRVNPFEDSSSSSNSTMSLPELVIPSRQEVYDYLCELILGNNPKPPGDFEYLSESKKQLHFGDLLAIYNEEEESDNNTSSEN